MIQACSHLIRLTQQTGSDELLCLLEWWVKGGQPAHLLAGRV